VFHALGAATVAQVNLPVAVLVWLMIVPMLLKIDLAALGQVGNHWRGIVTTVGVNWLVKPFSMALLGWLFIAHLFRPLLPADQIDGYIAGLILLAAAPCTAMVFVWSNLVDGEPHFTLSQVALNDTIMVVAFAPIVALLLAETECPAHDPSGTPCGLQPGLCPTTRPRIPISPERSETVRRRQRRRHNFLSALPPRRRFSRPAALARR
jgi:ACR3 family arsenite efflux pump ArsB